MAAVTKGTTISFSNTPQARDDQFASTGLTEDSLGVKYLDVMGNDLGGNAKTLYSLDDGNSPVSYTNPQGGSSPTDLLARDAVGSVNTSALGANISITADGKVAYDASPIQTQLQSLAAGEYATDSFTYAIQLGNGALSWATATVRITGVNDAPVISSQPADAAGAVQEDTTLIAAGTLAATDVDHNATQAWSVQGSAAGAYGAIAVDEATGKWTYTLANDSPAVQALAANESHDETFTVRVTDDQSAAAEQLVTVKVTGTNDAPVVSGTVTGTATEDGAPSVLNALANASDVDNGTTLTVTNLSALPAGLTYDADTHSFTLDPSNAAYQSLAAGATTPVSVNYSVSDGITSTPATASWTVTGINDAPVIGIADTTGVVAAMPAAPVGAPTPIAFTVEQYLGYTSQSLSDLRNYAAAHQANYTVQTNVIDYTDDPAGFAGELPGSSSWPAAQAQNVSGTDGINNSFFARITTNFSVPAADTYTFRTYNDDGVFLMIDNQLIINDSGIHPEAPFNGSIALSPGNHSLELFFFEFGGEASLELSARNSTGIFGLLGGSGGGLGGAQTLSDSGAISFSDVDLTDAHLVSAAPIGSVLGALTVEKNSDTTGTGTGGQFTWKYEVANSAVAYLAAGDTKVESFTVTVDDQHGGTVSRQVDVTITGVNDAPVAVNDAATTNEDTAVSIAVLANDTDPDAVDSMTIASATGAQHGSLSINGGNVVYTPSANYSGADSFTYTMKDAAGVTSSATVNVTVNPVTDTYTLSNLAVNGSFEPNTSGWTVTGDGVDVVSSSGWQPADGTYSLDLNAFHPGGVQQVLQTTPGVQYTVGFDLSKNPGNLTYATAQVSVDNTNQTAQSYTFSAGNSAANMMWSQQTFTFTATGATTTLSFASTYPTDSTGGFPINAQGPALDEVVVVTNKVINNFTTGSGGDVLQLHDLLTSIGAPHDGTAISGGYLRFAQPGSDTLVQIDPNGGGDAFMTVATLVGLSGPLDASNYVL